MANMTARTEFVCLSFDELPPTLGGGHVSDVIETSVVDLPNYD